MTVAIAGTHGKTTVTGMITKILVDAGKSPTAVVGSIMKDFASNFVSGKSDVFVVEACEYRKHLLHIAADVLVITNIEWDHTDFFETFAAYQDAFREEASRVPAHGAVVTDPSLPEVATLLAATRARIVDYTAEQSPKLKLLGEFNKKNARAAKAAVKAVFADITDESIDESLAAFQGTWRRFEFKGTTEKGAMVYDDYGHHPTEVRATLESARTDFPDKKIIVAFHPHLFSRTRDLMEDFAKAFSAADEVLIAPVFAAREEPIEGIDHHTLAEKIVLKKGNARALDSLEEIEAALRATAGKDDLIITMGAGDIYKVAEAIATP
jgi:UDP-N-acetylmuramate--alanine ligase